MTAMLDTGKWAAGAPRRSAHDEAALVIREQEGVITFAQARAAGMSKSEIRWHLARGDWQRLRTGVYATFSGPVPRRCRLWAAVLAAGPGAVLSHESAAELAGLAGKHPGAIHITIPEERRIRRAAGVVLHLSARIDDARHPALRPPQTRIEETIIDLTQTAQSLLDAFGWLGRAVNDRMTTEDRLLATMSQRPRLRWRQPLREALGDLKAGCRSVLELSYLREVERAHGLPAGERQSPVDAGPGRGRIYLDVRYRQYRVRVELDGRAAHPDHLRHRDWERDNLAAETHEAPLRYMTPEVVEESCRVAAQVARSLGNGGCPAHPILARATTALLHDPGALVPSLWHRCSRIMSLAGERPYDHGHAAAVDAPAGARCGRGRFRGVAAGRGLGRGRRPACCPGGGARGRGDVLRHRGCLR